MPDTYWAKVGEAVERKRALAAKKDAMAGQWLNLSRLAKCRAERRKPAGKKRREP